MDNENVQELVADNDTTASVESTVLQEEPRAEELSLVEQVMQAPASSIVREVQGTKMSASLPPGVKERRINVDSITDVMEETDGLPIVENTDEDYEARVTDVSTNYTQTTEAAADGEVLQK